MSELPLDEAIPRFEQNEDRFDKFVNDDGYTAEGGEEVPGLKNFTRIREIVNGGGSIAIDPNVFYKLGSAADYDISLNTPSNQNILNDYHFLITGLPTAATFAITGVSNWANGEAMPANLESGKAYEVSVVEGLGTWVEYS